MSGEATQNNFYTSFTGLSVCACVGVAASLLMCLMTNNCSVGKEIRNYYPFGMQMPGRTYNAGSSYRYGFNGKEKSDEIKGEGNSYTAEFWEYDPKSGRRWNVDPKSVPWESPYVVNGDNPIFYVDPLGDFKTKFGAWVYKATHGGQIDREKKSGQWYVSKQKKYDGPENDPNGAYVSVKVAYNWKGAASPINYGGKNPFTPWDVGVEWLSGTGNRQQNFKDGDPFTELYKQHGHVQQTRQMAIDQLKNSNGQNTGEGNNPYDLKGIEGVGKYIKDYSTLATAGAIGNIAFTYLGSHGLKYTITSVNIENRTAIVHFSAHNSSTIQSAMRPPVIGYMPWWQNTIGKRLNEKFKSGPMSRTEQNVDWTETIKW